MNNLFSCTMSIEKTSIIVYYNINKGTEKRKAVKIRKRGKQHDYRNFDEWEKMRIRFTKRDYDSGAIREPYL